MTSDCAECNVVVSRGKMTEYIIHDHLFIYCFCFLKETLLKNIYITQLVVMLKSSKA